MVILNEGNIPSLQWRLGRTIKILPGKENFIRVAEVKTPSGI